MDRLINWARVVGNELVDVKEDSGVVTVRKGLGMGDVN